MVFGAVVDGAEQLARDLKVSAVGSVVGLRGSSHVIEEYQEHDHSYPRLLAWIESLSNHQQHEEL